jgi:hypothetical protein
MSPVQYVIAWSKVGSRTGSTVPPEPPGDCASANAGVLSTSNKEEIEPQELLLLREFFLLLDEWDRPTREVREGAT